MAQNLRQQIAEDIVETLQNMTDPQPVLVTREPFEPDRLAITQFPAILVTATNETRELLTMGASGVGRKQGTISFNIRGYVRGNDLDKKRNDLIEAIEEALDADRYRSKDNSVVLGSFISNIEIIERLPPLAEIAITFEVTYKFTRATA